MIWILFILSVSAKAQTWSSEEVQRRIRNPSLESSGSYLSSLCEVQLGQHRVPTACYEETNDNKTMVRFLNERCTQWIGAEKDLKSLKNWIEHPKIHKECWQKVRERIAELEYVQEEKNPLEYFRLQKAQLARNLKSSISWKTSHSRKP